jgi:hypothetical protein
LTAPAAPRLLVVVALLHLAAVAGFIWTRAAEEAPGRVGEALRLYKNLSGAFRDYTFFAPAVASDVKAGFLLETADGPASFVAFRARNREVAFKYNSIIASSMRDERGRDLLAQSWAALMLGSHPAATSVTVVVEAFVLPTMPEYRAGARPEWRPIYAGTFARRDLR